MTLLAPFSKLENLKFESRDCDLYGSISKLFHNRSCGDAVVRFLWKCISSKRSYQVANWRVPDMTS